jgi:tagaturonate reductase
MNGRIIQFGTSRFLQAHAALFVHEAIEAGQAVGPIAVVQASGSSDRAGRVHAFGRPEGYPVIIRGVSGSERIDRIVHVRSVDRGLSAASDWVEISRLFAEEASFVISNTGDTGYQLCPGDELLPDDVAPKSFPAKLATLLGLRWKVSAASIVMLPCELVSGNGDTLKAAVLESARRKDMPAAFFQWLDSKVVFANTLVDRIVSEAIDPIGAVAEPYALWVIKNAPGVRLPCLHESIVLADNLEPYERLKLHILNLGHSFLAEIWTSEGRAADETVRSILAAEEVRSRLEKLYENEVIPGFASRGMAQEAQAYVATTLDRFLNPFLNHRIADIAQHHPQKVERRISAFLSWIDETGDVHEAPTLRGIARRYVE